MCTLSCGILMVREMKEGLLARTVPDKPNSRNQRYLTARNV